MASQQELVESSRSSRSMDRAQEFMQHNHTIEGVEIHGDGQMQALETIEHFRDMSPRRAHPDTPTLPTRQDWNYLVHEFPEELKVMFRAMNTNLNALHRDKYEKASLQKDLQRTQDDLKRATENLQEVQKKWKKATSQLDQLQSKEACTYQLADSELIGSVKQLRYNIRNFASQHFEGKAPPGSTNITTGNLTTYLLETTEDDLYFDYLLSPSQGPYVVQSFLWRLLVGEIFEKFCWAPRLRKAMNAVYETLRPRYEDEHNRRASMTSDAEQKFQNWKATTSTLILKSLREGEASGDMTDEVGESIDGFIIEVFNILQPFTRSRDERMLEDLRSIFETAICLDRDLCRQEGSVYWVFPPSLYRVKFNLDEMRVEQASRSGQYVKLVTAPALVKRGKTTGKNATANYMLLKMAVILS
ncbi:hypothetical protein FHL15_005020 [Xylaria flabelliformis]|uniref:Uncharacterized protein n=1 Tax=Xylaria flabelliformis TaxID=2512241 RepID=A0A553I175_9PEZI|nr:hypothetical protein FHL15_005020 [Xylaria flabelliformis]